MALSLVSEAFTAVLRCPNVRMCIENPAKAHPCREIIDYQFAKAGATSYDDFQLPEPWCGQIDVAPILFVSSNPSIGDDQRALGRVEDADAFDSHHFALGGGRGRYVEEGVYTLDPDGKRSKRPVYFWGRARDRAQELIPGRPVLWGRDYAMTEIVHCKSRNELGVVAALQECTSLHFDRTMGVAAASVIIAVGKGRALIRNRYTVPDTDMLAKRLIAGKERILLFLPHPSGFEPGPRSLSGLYSLEEMNMLRQAVASGLSARTQL